MVLWGVERDVSVPMGISHRVFSVDRDGTGESEDAASPRHVCSDMPGTQEDWGWASESELRAGPAPPGAQM